jgi:hypothetical protein
VPLIASATALLTLIQLEGQTLAAGHFAVGTRAATSPSWLPVAGAIGAVAGACIASVIGFLSSWYTQRRQRELASLTLELPYQPQAKKPGFRTGEREVRNSLIRIIRDHLRDNAAEGWQGYTFRFHRATFDGGDLSHIRISSKYLSFYGAEFISGTMDFRGSRFSGGDVSFQDAR